MKKQLLAGILALGTISMLCGFDSAETLDSLTEKMAEASQSMEGFSAAININADGALNISDSSTTTSLELNAQGEFDTDYQMEPFGMSMDGTLTYSFLGSGTTLTEKAYMVDTEDGQSKTYVYSGVAAGEDEGDNGSWSVDSSDASTINSIMSLTADVNYSVTAMKNYGFDVRLSSEACDIDGVECYEIDAMIDKNAIENFLNTTSVLDSSITQSEDVSSVLSMLEGIEIDFSVYVDTESYLPVYVHMDLNNSDFSLLSEVIGSYMNGFTSDSAESSSTEIVLNDFSIDAAYDYDEIPSVEVPQEALDAEANGASLSISDIAEEAAENIG